MTCIGTLQKLAESTYKLACIETDKPYRIRELFHRFSIETGCAVYEWIEDTGLRRIGFEHISIPKTRTPADVFSYIATARHFGIYLFTNTADHLGWREIEETLLQIHQNEDGVRRLVVLLDDDKVTLPERITPLTVKIQHKTSRPLPKTIPMQIPLSAAAMSV